MHFPNDLINTGLVQRNVLLCYTLLCYVDHILSDEIVLPRLFRIPYLFFMAPILCMNIFVVQSVSLVFIRISCCYKTIVSTLVNLSCQCSYEVLIVLISKLLLFIGRNNQQIHNRQTIHCNQIKPKA